MGVFYTGFKALVKNSLKVYFGKVRVEGLENIPRGQPMLVAPNHQNAFIDPFLAGSLMPIDINFLARQDIFKPWTEPILKSLNMMPVYRIRDGYASLSQNDAIFEACRGLFKANESILIFPEGNHGEHHYLRPLTKGAARLALTAQKEMDQDLLILPVGLNYFDHKKARAGALVVYGKPISVREHLAAFEESGARALLKFKDVISEAMKETLVIPDETEDYELRKKIVFQKSNVGKSLEELRSFDITKAEVPAPKKRGRIARIFNPLPFYAIKRVVSGLKDPVFISSMKYAIGLVTFPLWWLVVFLVLFPFVGIPLALFTVFVMVIGLFYSYS